MKEKTIYKKISVALDPEVLKKLEEGNYNKSKLIDSLLSDYFNSQKKDEIKK